MRTTRTLILRLLVDADEPNVLRGVLRPVSETDEHPFADEEALLVLLRQMTRMPRENDGSSPPQTN